MTEALGPALRAARRRRGLSQEALADGIITASFLSLVESGKRVPSAHVLAQLAARLGVDPSDPALGGPDVPALRVAIARAESMLAAGDFTHMLEALPDAALPDPADEPDLLATARYLRGRALEGCGRVQDALPELVDAVALADARGDLPRVLDWTIDLLRCLRERGDFREALDRAQALLPRVPQALVGTGVHGRLVSTLIGLHYVRGDLGTALDVARRALDQFANPVDPTARGVVLWNASLAAEAAGEAQVALEYATEAAECMRTGSDPRLRARLQLMAAGLHTRIQPPDAALAAEQLEACGAVIDGIGTDIDRASLQLEWARVHLLRKDFDAALDAGRRAATLLSHSPVAFAAGAHLLLARAYAGMHDMRASREHFQAARMVLATTEASRNTAVFWRELADDYRSLGYVDDAMNAYAQALSDAGVSSAGIDAMASPASAVRSD